jgi:hypothetical protein
MTADTESAIKAIGKNERAKMASWEIFTAGAGRLLTPAADPVMTQQIIGLIAGVGE